MIGTYGDCQADVAYTAAAIVFGAAGKLQFLPYPVSILGITFDIIGTTLGVLAFAQQLKNTGRIHVTQYRSSGAINNATIIRTVKDYYAVDSKTGEESYVDAVVDEQPLSTWYSIDDEVTI